MAGDLDSVLLEALFLLQLVIAFGAWSGMLLASCSPTANTMTLPRESELNLRKQATVGDLFLLFPANS